jgi:hypothetical protein
MITTNELHDRINRVINTPAFEAWLVANNLDLIEFQCTWHKLSQGDFNKLPKAYQDAILVGEAELKGAGEIVLA